MLGLHPMKRRGGSSRFCCALGAGTGALLAALLLSPAALAGPTAGALVLASTPSPFASCTVGGPGTNYPNAEVEPFVAVNPTDPSNVIGVYQQDRWDNGGAHGLVTAYSSNGGQSFAHTFPHFSTCAGGTAANGGNYDRSSDPWSASVPTVGPTR